MLVTFVILPLGKLALVLVLLLARPADHVLENLLYVWLFLDEVLLLEGKKLVSLILGNHNLLDESVQRIRFGDLTEEEQNAHQLAHCILVLSGDHSFLLKKLEQVLFFERTSLLDLLLFFHLVHCLVLLSL